MNVLKAVYIYGCTNPSTIVYEGLVRGRLDGGGLGLVWVVGAQAQAQAYMHTMQQMHLYAHSNTHATQGCIQIHTPYLSALLSNYLTRPALIYPAENV